jgi:diguanylate cyclase (GGDEF)-like protein
VDRTTNGSPEASAEADSDDVRYGRLSRHRVWVAVAVPLAVVGVLASVLAARAVAHGDAEHSRQALRSSSAEVASTLQLAIQHHEDLVVNASAFILANPDASSANFGMWATAANVLRRYPELESLSQIVIVPRSELAAHAARASSDHARRRTPHEPFKLTPPGARPYYCLGGIALVRRTVVAPPPGLDFCAFGTLGAPLIAARDSGLGSYEPLDTELGTKLGVQVPIYRGGVVPATVVARRAAFVAWVGMLTDPEKILRRALQAHPGMAVSLRYHLNSSNVVFSSGKAPDGAESVTVDLRNGWTATTSGAVAGSSVLGNDTALALLLAGVGLSILLVALVFVLATSRARALRLVGLRTRELRYQALHDPLTGLPNRALLHDRTEQLLTRSRRQGTLAAALFIDLDDFKNVNDTLGHESGDRLLVAVAARLESTLRDADTIGRMGGDEFVVLLDGASLEVAPPLVAERLLEVMRRPFALEGAVMPLVVNTSVGIAIGDRSSPGDLLRDADVALYQAKAAGKNRYEIFSPAMQTDVGRRIELEFDLRSATEGEQFRLEYQPIYNLDDLTLVGVEALIRWEHPVHGLVQPDEFVPILEQTGQIRETGRWVLRQACLQMAAWHERGNRLDVSVNVSARQLDDDGILDDIRDALEMSGLVATSLVIEVTETALMRNAAATARRLGKIKQLGVRIAVDDFGTGYSSLGYLQQFPVDCLKIDRSFTSRISSSAESKSLVRTLVQLGKDLGLTTLAEGIETPGQMDHLRSENVNEVQGFLFSRPLGPDTLETLLLPAESGVEPRTGTLVERAAETRT